MSFRLLVALAVSVALGVSVIAVMLVASYVQLRIGDAFIPTLAVQVQAVFQSLLLQQVLALFFVNVLIALGVYAALVYTIARPLGMLVNTMDTYAKTGEQVQIPEMSGAPREIESLAVAFSAFVTRAEESHKHDTEISRVKSDFISTAAHQLRTPLTGIRWALEALEKEPLNEGQKALVASATGKSKDLVAIVGTLLDISAIESGKYKYTFTPTDMHQMVEELVRDFGPIAAQKQVSLFYAHEAGQEVPLARADGERVKWVLNNLIDNAIQYTQSGGTIRISLEGSRERVFVRVKDNGIGIPQEDRANIFERFYRAQNAVTKQQKGNGLGLYIARTIATDHGGDLNFQANTDGPGTTFTLALPIAS